MLLKRLDIFSLTCSFLYLQEHCIGMLLRLYVIILEILVDAPRSLESVFVKKCLMSMMVHDCVKQCSKVLVTIGFMIGVLVSRLPMITNFYYCSFS